MRRVSLSPSLLGNLVKYFDECLGSPCAVGRGSSFRLPLLHFPLPMAWRVIRPLPRLTWRTTLVLIGLFPALYFTVRGISLYKSTAYIDKLAAMPSSEIDLGMAALNLAKEFHPDLEVDRYSEKLTDLAWQVHLVAEDSEDPAKRIQALNTVIFTLEGYRFDQHMVETGIVNEGYLNRTLDTKIGGCPMLALLYVAVAQRLGYPVFPVVVPGHVFARYLLPDGSYENIETSRQGLSLEDDHYLKDYSVEAKSLEAGSYLQTLSNQEFAAYLLNINAKEHMRPGDYERGMAYAEKAVALNPLCGECWDSLRSGARLSGMITEGEAGNRLFDRAEESGGKVEALGFTPLQKTAVWKRTYTE